MMAPKARLLIIDDDITTIRLMSDILAGEAELLFATNGEKALRLARDKRPDLILLDAEMPEMDGFAVCEALKSDPDTATSAVIFVTAHSNIEYETRALKLGAVDFIAKPISPPILRARVRTQLTLKHQTDTLRTVNQRLEERVLERTAELESANHDLLVARDAALAATRAKSDFLAMMSHELRTPMNGILGMVDVLLNTDLSDTQRKYAKIVDNAGRGLQAIISDILDFSRCEAGRLRLDIDDFSASMIIGETLSLLKLEAERKKIDFVTNICETVPHTLVGDATRIRQIIFNIVGNAIKFTQAGSVEVTVTYEAVASLGDLHISVTDTGIGIAPDKHHAVFECFTQGDSSVSRTFGGTGLGLAISKKLCELMGGRIGLESEPGAGSTFWVTIPCLREDNRSIRVDELILEQKIADRGGACSHVFSHGGQGAPPCACGGSHLPTALSNGTFSNVGNDGWFGN